MAYKCPQCGHTSEQAGNCPTCSVPMAESEDTSDSAAPENPSA